MLLFRNNCTVSFFLCRVRTAQQCCQLDGFPAQLGCFFRCVGGNFLLLRVAVFWAGFIKVHAGFWAVFAKDFSIRGIVFLNFAEVVKFVLT